MPDSDPQLMTVFAEALERTDPADRAAYLDGACQGNAPLRRRVEVLLAAHDGAGRFLEPGATGLIEPAAPEALDGTAALASATTPGTELLTGEPRRDSHAPTIADTPPANGPGGFVPGQIIAGRYTLLEVLGEGGMGTVYRAEQSQPVKRQVALKLIKTGMDSRAVLARFDAERQALALMDHPNIARVYDGGATEAQQPFFVMELVSGIAITEYCDCARLTVRARLELFVAVCQAVQHAHQKGIIHRDLKPGNILVTELDGRPTPKVIDFGVAKAIEFNLTDQSLADTGAIVGTPTYMSPEQADPSSMDIDTRTDIYALGVILYELLAGSPPIDAKQFQRGAVLEVLRMVREVTPPRPSTKVSTAAALPSIAAGRGVDPEHLKRSLRGDLDWIVMKALEKDRTRRYETANGFAADVLRHMAHEPVVAAPPSRSYRLRKFIRKHQSGVIAASLVLLALLAGIAGATWGLIEARRHEHEARRQESIARAEASEKEKARTKALAAAEAEKKAKETAEAAEEAGRKLLYTTDMRLASFLWSDDRSTAEQFRAVLAKHIPGRVDTRNEGGIAAPLKPDLRGFEWYYYQNLLENSATVFSEHSAPVADAAFAGNGQLVTLDRNGQVRRWDLDSHDEEEASFRELPGGPGAQARVLSPTGRLAALAERNKVHVFETSTGKETVSIDSVDTAPGLIFSRDGERLVIVDRKVRWCNASSGEMSVSDNQQFKHVNSVALSADGLTLAVVGHDDSSHMYSVYRLDPTAKIVITLAKNLGGSTGSKFASALSPDGRRVALSFLEGAIGIYDTATDRGIAYFKSAHPALIATMAFNGDGTKLATADSEGTIKIWGVGQTLTGLRTLKGHQGSITKVGFSADGNRLVTTGVDRTARVWELTNPNARIRPLEAFQASSGAAACFSPDGQLIAGPAGILGFGGRGVRLWDAATGRPVRDLQAVNATFVYSLAFSPTDKRLLALGHGGEPRVSYVSLWDIDAGMELARLPGATDLPDFTLDLHTGAVGTLTFSIDGKYLVAGFGSKSRYTRIRSPGPLKVWEVATRRPTHLLNGHVGHCTSLDFSRDGRLLASGSRDGSAIIWSTDTWNRVRTLQNPDRVIPQLNARPTDPQAGMMYVEGVAFSPDGKTLAMASESGRVHLWDVATGKLLETLKGHSSAVRAVAFSPDGLTLASGSSDATVRLWNVQTRRELMQLERGSVDLSHLRVLVFSPNGRQLLAGGSKAGLWSAESSPWDNPDRAAEKLRRLLESNADFPSRVRLLSANLRLLDSLEKLENMVPGDVRVRAALSETRARYSAEQAEAAGDWERAIAEYRKVITNQPADSSVLAKLATAYQAAGRTREAVPHLATLCAANPGDTILLMKVAALQAWFGQDEELAVTCQRALAMAKDTNDPRMAERVATACSLRGSEGARHDAALVLARRAVELGKGHPSRAYFRMALGMAEYRSEEFAAADAALAAAMDIGKYSPHILGISAFYRAMSLFREGRPDEARAVARAAAAGMTTPLPADDQNPLAGAVNHDDHADLILWLAYKEAKALIQFHAAPVAGAQRDGK